MTTFTRRQFIQTSALATMTMGINQISAQTNIRKPNFVIIMADDLGYGDIGCFGNESILTPRLDQMAQNGMRFTDYHSNGAVCTPTRAALLTGRYQQRCGLEGVIYVRGETREIGIDPDEITYADVLKQAGYQTGVFGKWHLGYQKQHNPIHLGFDEFRGYVSGNIDFHSHVDNAGIPDWWHNEEQVHEEGYVTKLITDHAINFIQSHKDQPFCCYIAHEAPHWPYQGPNDPADRFPGVSFNSQGSSDDYPAAYKAMIESMDKNIGRLIDEIEKLNLQNDTFIFFCSDNGGVPNLGNNGKFRGDKGSLWEGGHRVPAIAYWPGKIEAGTESDQTLMSMDIFPTLASLASASIPNNHTLDGMDVTALLLGENMQLGIRPVFWHYRNQKAVRLGPWKYLKHNDEEHLFNLDDDITEQTNLIEKQPTMRSTLRNHLHRWEREMNQIEQKTT